MRNLFAFKTVLPAGMAVMYVGALSADYPIAVATVDTIIVAMIATLITMCFSAAASPSMRAMFPAALAATSATWAAFIASAAIAVDAFAMANQVMPTFAILVVAALGVATIGALKNTQHSLMPLLAHDVLWTGAIGIAVFFGATFYGAIATVAAIGLPLILLKYETKKNKEKNPVGLWWGSRA